MQVAAAEVGAALALSRLAATRRVELAVALTTRLPRTLAALAVEDIDLPRARASAEATTTLSDAQAGAVEARVLSRAPGQTTPGLRASLARAVISVDPAAAQARHERAVADRSVRL